MDGLSRFVAQNQNVNRATIWPLRGWSPVPFSQGTNPKPEDNRPPLPLKVLLWTVGEVVNTGAAPNAAPFAGWNRTSG